MKFRVKSISQDLFKQIDDMQKKINETFRLKISKIQASKIVSWKAKSYNINLTAEKLLKILGDNNV
jgi:hypothetical protein